MFKLVENMGEEYSDKERNDLKKHGFDLLFHEDKLFTTRVNLLLVAESLLFISYVTSLNMELNKCISVVISGLGITITIFFGFVNIRASENLEKLKEEIEKIFTFYQKIRKKRVWGFC